jgi:membrane-associated phospholipid phosphatase
VCFFVDEFVREFVRTIHTDFLDKIFSFGHWYGKPSLTIFSFLIFYFGGLVLALVSSEKIPGSILFWKDEFRAIGLKIFEAFIFSGIIVTTIKSIFGRWRPYTEHGSSTYLFFTLGPNDHLSFPSGDVAVAFSFSVIIAGIFEHKLWKIFWYLLASITAVGRIYHDQHWLSDVITASMISILVGLNINKQNKIRDKL